MSTKEKLLARLVAEPADFTFQEAQTLLESLGYKLRYQIIDLKEQLIKEGIL